MTTDLSRRGFLAGGGTAAVSTLGFNLEAATAVAKELKIARTTHTHSVCPYCAVGCSVVIHTLGDKARNVKPAVVHIEGDPESPVNQSTTGFCPFCSALDFLSTSSACQCTFVARRRLKSVS